MEEKAMLRSATAGGTIGATDEVVRVDDCAYPNGVRSRPEANTRPPTNAATRAPPKVMRVIGLDFILFSPQGSNQSRLGGRGFELPRASSLKPRPSYISSHEVVPVGCLTSISQVEPESS